MDARILAPSESPDIIYFSSASENTHRFVQKLNRAAARIPLRPKIEGTIQVSRPYVLIVPSYGGGEEKSAVPKQVIKFLNNPTNRQFLRGVITSGNTNFGSAYCIAGSVISAKCHVPNLYQFELLGTDYDVARVNEGLDEFFAQLNNPDEINTSIPIDSEIHSSELTAQNNS
ncbi:NrdI protein involved in ribonucleotide reduction [Corynebacterium kutscheri]|uniref:Protein NrdI n=1 Tax=Corynebacterium kutscheri TaxID=35755 RepID=A0A0F6R098_9CORY|nr:class Ib ribonucleoside-diphosphate reductase assembly flavoprotein NrdI [Corynebacterium kutscheri]AKE41175.1 ribonucleoside-diphosphate reductase 2, operon protein nrdI [Corynebacterium kutscheri]VEH08451.1 NrdI protein involved in ribonucleotide reduction [Corynebacterium kutscheri]VEH09497.1 NrdI protein involved in ribonucleotide reduction [Corynebacterium kutscheri]VEH79580.1 NrdI protein involved in ribonucleotide reduction [Corynebacterium kutscheri]